MDGAGGAGARPATDLPALCRLAVVLVLVSLATCLGPSHAEAHTNLRSAVPGPNSSTNGAPAQVQLHFGQSTVPDRRTHVSVLIPSGRDIARGDAVSGGFGVAQRLATAREKGWYRVRYSVVFVDGHVGSGVFRFRVTTFDKAAPNHWKWVWFAAGGWLVYLTYVLLRHGRQLPALAPVTQPPPRE
jgi:methionine-rich copper-binding protein CopC